MDPKSEAEKGYNIYIHSQLKIEGHKVQNVWECAELGKYDLTCIRKFAASIPSTMAGNPPRKGKNKSSHI